MDGYHVSHDPAKPSTTEPTTGRSLNILDVPNIGSRASVAAPPLSISSRGATTRYSNEIIPKGRSLSPSKIVHPKPSKPYASRRVREADYSTSPGVDDLTAQLEQASLYRLSNSPPSSVGSSLSSRSSGGSSPSSLSSLSDPASSGSECRCNRYGITRKGDRVKLDCGGSRCGYSDESSSGCSSDDSEAEEDEEPQYQPQYHAPRPSQRQPQYQEIKPRTSTAGYSYRPRHR